VKFYDRWTLQVCFSLLVVGCVHDFLDWLWCVVADVVVLGR